MKFVPFKIESPFTPKGDQEQAIAKLVKGLEDNRRVQVLLGATGTGKTVIAVADGDNRFAPYHIITE